MSISSVDIASVALFVLGFAAGLLVFVMARLGSDRNSIHNHKAEIARYEATLADLRREHAERIDEIHMLRQRVVDPTHSNVEAVRSERDWALEEVDKLNRQRQEMEVVLAERERSLREARMAIHEIRLHIERERSVPIGKGAGPGIGGPARSLSGPAAAIEAPKFKPETTQPMGQDPAGRNTAVQDMSGRGTVGNGWLPPGSGSTPPTALDGPH